MTPAERAYYQKAYLIVLKFPRQFREGFEDWLWDNISIQLAFDVEAKQVLAQGRTSYSSQTILEYMRHYTLLRSSTDEFKIANVWGASMARLWMHMNPAHAGFFKTAAEVGGIAAFSLV